MSLHEHGIQNEQSDLRAHVCGDGYVYIFRTSEALRKCKERGYRQEYAEQPGVDGATGRGYWAPLKEIYEQRAFAGDLLELADIRPKDSPKEKGRKAEWIVEMLLRAGRFPVAFSEVVKAGFDGQMRGIDFLVQMKASIQVKCDLPGGFGEGRTGRLFIQTAERNPLRQW